MAASTPATLPAIELEHLVIRFGSFTAVNDLSLQVRQGEVFGLLGPNGAGKTTTFQSLTAQVNPTSGAIRILGFDVQKEFGKVKERCGYVPDLENHFEEFTAGENLRIFCDLYGAPRSRVDVCLDQVELLREKNVVVRAFSRGMRRKLLVARELLHQPKVLLMDEPTANLDVHSTALIRKLIRDMAAAGSTVLVTTHDMKEVEEICDRVAIIHHGKLVDLDSPQAFKSRNTERIVDVVFSRDGVSEKVSIDLADDVSRNRFADLLRSEAPLTTHTREFDFGQVFLKLTGEAYQ